MNDIQLLEVGAQAIQRSRWTLSFESGDPSLEVRRFHTEEGLNRLFTLTITAVSLNPDLDLAAFVGSGAVFSAVTGVAHALVGQRAWSGVCRAMDLIRVESTGLSTYELVIVPRLWQLTQRRNHRLFQHISIPDIVGTLLGEWSIEPDWHIARDTYPKLELRVQYGESDYDFFCRLLEEAGITFSFVATEGGTRLVLDDQPHSGALRAAALPFRDNPGQVQAARQEYVTAVRLHEEVRPARHIVRDFDYRRPKFRLEGSSGADGASHALMEQYFYRPGASLAEVGKAAGTPSADDKGMARHADEVGQALADRSLKASRGPRRVVRFVTSAIDLAPGVIFALADHPRGELGPEQRLLVTRVELEGAEGEEWRMSGKAVFAGEPFHPPQATPKPQIHGLQSALVVGPDGQEIYTDEFGRVRVQFHWDREGDNNDDSSVWMRVVYNASGPGYGIVSIPRVGHEVIIAFMEGDPDLPMVVGSTYNATSPVPYDLPDNKTVSTWKAASSPGGEGFNEIKMENKTGHELLYQQAEKDLAVLVKNDEVHLVGHDRSVMVEHDEVKSVKNDRTHVVQHDERTSIQNDRVEQVGHDEHVGIGNDRVHQIKKNETLAVGDNHVIQVGKSAVLAVGENRSVHVGKDEQVSIGQDQSVSVGQSRSTSVGINDSLQVGSRYTVTVSNGLKGKLASVLGSVLDGGALSSLSQVVGPFATGPLQQVVGKLAKTSMGATPLSALIKGPAAALQELLPGPLQGVASMVSGQIDSLLGGLFGVSGGQPTTFDMVDKKITITTGDASIVLDGGKIILQAKEGIFLTSAEIGVQGAAKVEIVAGMHPVALAAAAAGKPPPEAMKGALLLSGMKELAAISPDGHALFGAKEGLRVGCDAKIEVIGTKGATLASSEGDAIVLGKTVQLNPPAAPKKEKEPEATPIEEAEAPDAAAFENAEEYHFAENVHLGDEAIQEGADATALEEGEPRPGEGPLPPELDNALASTQGGGGALPSKPLAIQVLKKNTSFYRKYTRDDFDAAVEAVRLHTGRYSPTDNSPISQAQIRSTYELFKGFWVKNEKQERIEGLLWLMLGNYNSLSAIGDGSANISVNDISAMDAAGLFKPAPVTAPTPAAPKPSPSTPPAAGSNPLSGFVDGAKKALGGDGIKTSADYLNEAKPLAATSFPGQVVTWDIGAGGMPVATVGGKRYQYQPAHKDPADPTQIEPAQFVGLEDFK